jgi:hypothetical protein
VRINDLLIARTAHVCDVGILPALAVSRLPASELLSPREGGDEDKCSEGLVRDPDVMVDITTAVRRGRHRRRQIDMTNKDSKAEIRARMAKTGESYVQGRRKVIEDRSHRQPASRQAGEDHVRSDQPGRS